MLTHCSIVYIYFRHLSRHFEVLKMDIGWYFVLFNVNFCNNY